ncbi:MAG: S53 family peptidase [Dehalococcoidia bacterium]
MWISEARALRRPALRLAVACVACLFLSACVDGSPGQFGSAGGSPIGRAVAYEIEHAITQVQSAQARALVTTAPLTAKQLLARQQAPTTKECMAAGISACYAPAQLQHAYGVDQLLAQGIDGSGQTVVIIDSFGSPTLVADVQAFSRVMGLPDADISEEYPLGMDFKELSAGDTADWQGETTLDAEWAHAMAPGARIVVLVSPVSETEGVDGMPEFMALEQYALDNQLGTVISQSWGTSENLLDDPAGAAMRAQFDDFYQKATAAGITVLTAAGDHGPLGDNLDESPASVRAADWPSAAPWVTTVGGTILSLNNDGSYASERVLQGSSVAGGSGISRFYDAPSEQAVLPGPIKDLAAGKRAEADVSAIGSGLIVYFATGGQGDSGHAEIIGGTSASTPIWAGIVALANQAAGKGLGNINPTLYSLGAAGRCFHDVTSGRNAFRADPGDPALPGYDLPTGWGTPDASCLVPALAAAASQ